MSLTHKDFLDFDRSARLAARTGTTTPAPTVATAGGTLGISTPMSKQLDSFKKGIKRDPTLFPILNDEKAPTTWHREMEVQAKAQGVDDVLDDSYIPATAIEQDLFKEKNRYMYSVLMKVVKSDRGRSIVTSHFRDKPNDSDAQAAYKELHEYHLRSFKATDRSGDMMAFIATASISDWNGTTEQFIIYWKKQRDDYHVHSGKTIDDGMCLLLLQRAVSTIPELQTIKTTIKLHERGSAATSGGTDFERYYALIVEAAVAYDKRMKSTNRSKRHMLTH